MSGTSVSAAAVIATHGLLDAALTADELTALALSAPALDRQVFPRLPEDSPSRSCVENLTAFLAQGDEESLRGATEALTTRSVTNLVHGNRISCAGVGCRSCTLAA